MINKIYTIDDYDIRLTLDDLRYIEKQLSSIITICPYGKAKQKVDIALIRVKDLKKRFKIHL